MSMESTSDYDDDEVEDDEGEDPLETDDVSEVIIAGMKGEKKAPCIFKP